MGEETKQIGNKEYHEIALIYNYLMRSIDYKGWARYIRLIYSDLELENKQVLEIAAGTCKVAKYAQKKFPDLIVSDLSISMLKTAKEFRGLKVCCDMRQLPFKKKFDYGYSTFDSVNYLLTEEDLKKFFNEVNSMLVENGAFTFDVSLEKNSVKYEKLLNRKGKHKGIRFQQFSNYDREKRIHENKFKIILTNDEEVIEIHRQRIYDLEDYFRILEECGFYVVNCYDGFSFDDVHEETDRAQFIIRKQ